MWDCSDVVPFFWRHHFFFSPFLTFFVSSRNHYKARYKYKEDGRNSPQITPGISFKFLETRRIFFLRESEINKTFCWKRLEVHSFSNFEIWRISSRSWRYLRRCRVCREVANRTFSSFHWQEFPTTRVCASLFFSLSSERCKTYSLKVLQGAIMLTICVLNERGL